ncbi:MAG: DUF6338 family protein [Terriglobales bacterium]|jgi:hypothetical protein
MSLPLSEPVEHVAEFIVYAMPGFLALHIYRSMYPVKGLSEFLQVAWSVIYGVALAGLVRGIDARYLGSWLHSADDGFPRLAFILALVVVGVSWGLLLAGVNRARLDLSERFPRLRSIAPDVQSIWAKVNRAQSTDWAVVFADDGAMYVGWIKEFTYVPDAADNDFLLSRAKRLNTDGSVQYEVDGQGVYLSTRNVKRIEFVRGE